MDANEIKARLDAVDAELAAKLRELGFTEDEIKRQLDNSIPAETRKAEAEQILARKFVADLNDPNSGLMDQLVDRAVDQAETEFPGIKKEMADRTARRKKIAIGIGVAVALAAIIVWFAVLRTPIVSLCTRLAQPIDELSTIVGRKLHVAGLVDQGEYCTLTVTDERKSDITLLFAVHSVGRLRSVREIRDTQPFSKIEVIRLPTGTGWLYLAGPPARDASGSHMVLFDFGSKMLELTIDRDVTPDVAHTIATTIATRAKAAAH